MKIPNHQRAVGGGHVSLARIVSEDSQLSVENNVFQFKSSKDS